MQIQNNTIAKWIAARRWVRRLEIFDLPEHLWVKKENHRFYLNSKDWKGPSYHVLNWGIETYETQNIDFLKSALSKIKNPIFFDIGANIGIFSFELARMVKDIEVYSFEPEKTALSCFTKTLKEGNWDKVHLFPFAVSDQSGPLEIFSDGENHGGHSLHPEMILAEKNQIVEKEIIQAVTLDQFVSDHRIKKIDAIKMDIQGHEAFALKGARESLTKFRPIVLMECQYNQLFDPDSSLLEPFRNNNYKVVKPGTLKTYPLDQIQKEDFISSHKTYEDLVFVPTEKSNLFL